MKYKRRYEDRTKQSAYENACDCHYYGMGKINWNDCGVDEEERKIIWKQAFDDLANDF